MKKMSFFGTLFSGFTSNDKGCDWYCDSCGAYLNSQPGFTAEDDEWRCTECGTINDVSENNIIDDDYDDSSDDDDEAINVYDAADIYFSNGCDEDYMFGYTHEELDEAFNEG